MARAVTPEAGTVYRQLGVRLWGEGAYEREPIDGSQTKYSSLYRVETDDIVVNKIWARNGSVATVPAELAGSFVSSEFPTFAVDDRRLDPRWFHWITKTRSFWAACDAQSQGTSGKNRIRPERFLAIEIPLPPLDEQRRIVAGLDATASKLERTTALRQRIASELDVLWQSALAQAFARGRDFTMEEVCSEIVDNLHSTPTYDGDEFLCVRSQDIGWGSISYADALRTSREEFLMRTRRAEPRAGDIVFVREGDVGRCAVVDGSRRFSLGQRVMMLRPNREIIDPSFLTWQLMSAPVLRDQVLRGKAGTTSHHVNVGHIRTVRVLVPSPREQGHVVRRLAALRSAVREIRSVLAQADGEQQALRASILARALAADLLPDGSGTNEMPA